MIKIYNDNNDILIDGELIHPHLHEAINKYVPKGHIVGGAYDNSRFPKITTVSFSPLDTPPFVGFNAENIVLQFRGFNTNSSGQYVSFDVAPPIYTSGGAYVDFFIYDTGFWGNADDLHGIEVFNENGNRIFHSGRETLQVVQTGSETIHLEYGNDDKKRVYFSPQNKKPKVWVGTTGAYYTDPSYSDLGGQTQYYGVFLGDMTKDSNGNWDSFLLDVAPIKQLENDVKEYKGQGVWDFPYTVLI